jgi:antitoxin (DNA-binding transcriptional repressor) of toxin-antitoxin stability system
VKRKPITTTGAEEARQGLPAILDAAAAGRATVITRRGRAVAAVVPVEQARLGRPASLLALAGSGRGLWGDDSRRAITRLRDEWKR